MESNGSLVLNRVFSAMLVM
jgi:hypothetical protein